MANHKLIKSIKIIAIILTIVLFSFYSYSYYNKAAMTKQVEEEKAIQALIQSIKDGNKIDQEKAIREVAKMGKTAVKPLISAFKDTDLHFRRRAANALITIGEPAMKPLIDVLEDNQQNVRRSAAFALQKSNPDWVKSDEAIDAIPELIMALKVDDRAMQEDAVEMLVKIGTPAVELLKDALDDDLWYVRAHAAGTLGKIMDTTSVEALIEVLGDDHWQVRMAVVFALGKMRNARALLALEKVLEKEKSYDVKQAAKIAHQRLTMLIDTVNINREDM